MKRFFIAVLAVVILTAALAVGSASAGMPDFIGVSGQINGGWGLTHSCRPELISEGLEWELSNCGILNKEAIMSPAFRQGTRIVSIGEVLFPARCCLLKMRWVDSEVGPSMYWFRGSKAIDFRIKELGGKNCEVFSIGTLEPGFYIIMVTNEVGINYFYGFNIQ